MKHLIIGLILMLIGLSGIKFIHEKEVKQYKELAEEYRHQRDSIAISSAEKSRDILFWERLDRNRGYKIP